MPSFLFFPDLLQLLVGSVMVSDDGVQVLVEGLHIFLDKREPPLHIGEVEIDVIVGVGVGVGTGFVGIRLLLQSWKTN